MQRWKRTYFSNCIWTKISRWTLDKGCIFWSIFENSLKLNSIWRSFSSFILTYTIRPKRLNISIHEPKCQCHCRNGIIIWRKVICSWRFGMWWRGAAQWTWMYYLSKNWCSFWCCTHVARNGMEWNVVERSKNDPPPHNTNKSCVPKQHAIFICIKSVADPMNRRFSRTSTSTSTSNISVD